MHDSRYLHDPQVHQVKDAEHIVPLIIDLFNPSSALDVGCGLGTFLKIFIDAGIKDVLGVDGHWLDQSKLVIDKKYIRLEDLENKIDLHRRFDIALCLEVAEHLSEKSAEFLVETLTQHSDVIIFSAAIPYQGGQNHINEQWIEYWEALFNKHNYSLHDLIRPRIWNDKNIFWWYRQNMVVAIKTPSLHRFDSAPVHNYVHPELYISKVGALNTYKEWIDNIFNGNVEVEIAEQILKNALKFHSVKQQDKNEEPGE